MNKSVLKRNSVFLVVAVLISSSVSFILANRLNSKEQTEVAMEIDLEAIKSSVIEQLNKKLPDEPPVIDDSLDKLKKQYANLNEKISDLSEERQLADKRSIMEEDRELTQEEESQLAAQRRAENLAMMETTLYTEPVDDNWSLESEMAVMDSLADVSEKLNIESVECASTLCALHIAGNGTANGSDVMHDFSRNINWQGEMTMQYDLNTGKGVAYLAREGFSLPVAAH